MAVGYANMTITIQVRTAEDILWLAKQIEEHKLEPKTLLHVDHYKGDMHDPSYTNISFTVPMRR